MDAILAAGRLQFAGIGDAGVVAMSGYYKFFRLGMNVYFSQDYDVALMMTSQLGKGDVLVAVSHSGKTKTTLNTLHCAKERGATVIAVTNSPYSPIGKQADILLSTAVFGENMIGEVWRSASLVLPFGESVHQCAGAHRRRAAAAA
ncbi:SIS domain-containing protein [Hominenteromicrobium sp.]|uniref:SIS domain-containing protein n=1 Tax=Hominenteromicrobium sp. TaxID=3073581 RepID=UPI003992ED07